MNHSVVWRRVGAVAATLLCATVVACESPVLPDAEVQLEASLDRVGTGGLTGLAKEVRQVTARYHSTEQATLAGYGPSSTCVAVPGLGGMGFHWGNGPLIDPLYDPLAPEVVLYEPGPRGQLRLVAIEYIVIDVGQPAPTFDGRPFDVGGTPVPVPHWSLHVWVHKENPNGLFTPFNPNVSCS